MIPSPCDMSVGLFSFQRLPRVEAPVQQPQKMLSSLISGSSSGYGLLAVN